MHYNLIMLIQRWLVPLAGTRYKGASMKKSLRLALRSSVVKRALKYAVIVGLILITINYGDVILRGELSSGRLFKMALTMVVPYVVSTLSSVGALREKAKAESAGAG